MPEARANEALAAAAVSKRFGGLVAVDNMSFSLVEKEVLGLIGPNGSGKTTMMNLISGALKPSSGDIKLYGDTIAGIGASKVASKGVARTFQLVRMLPAMTVGLPNAGNAPVSTLTYIDQKRVELARALASDPKVLLLDEWLAGLNPTELKIGIALIEQLRAEGCTIIIVEHVMHAIRSLCDRCVVMNSGAKIAEGTPAEVLADHGVIRAYLGDENA
jgi:branched-chain amino acid transport system ATP-binding protein